MRCVLFAVLITIPVSIITWVIARGTCNCPVCALISTEQNSITSRNRPAVDADLATTKKSKLVQSQTITPIAKKDIGRKTEKPLQQPFEDKRLQLLLKTPLADFKIIGQATLYNDKGLFEYINGAAPIYIERHFRKLLAAEIQTAQGGELTCDIYDMRNAKNAQSIFKKESPPQVKRTVLGDEARKSAMALVFRKGRYYIKLTAFDDDAEKTLPVLAKILVARIIS